MIHSTKDNNLSKPCGINIGYQETHADMENERNRYLNVNFVQNEQVGVTNVCVQDKDLKLAIA